MTTELATMAAKIDAAASYIDVFGMCDGDSAKQSRHIKQIYRRLAKATHPDRYESACEQAVGAAAFERLNQLLQEAERAIREGVYGRPVVLATVQTRQARHEIINRLATGDLTTVYKSRSTVRGQELATVCKVALSPGDKDLLQVEAKALKRLRGPDTNELAHPYMPELVDSFTYQERVKPARAANVIRRLEGFYDLEQVRQAFAHGFDPLHMAWIWRRLLVALDHAHRNKVVHGAVLPQHIMILPEQHGVVLIDWCYASLQEDDDYPPIKAVAKAYTDWYPKEVMCKQSPSPATDIAMAARCMVHLLGGDPLTGNFPVRVPRQLRAFFKGCLLTKQAARPDDAWELLQEFDQLLQRMGAPYYPRRFRPFIMPTQ